VSARRSSSCCAPEAARGACADLVEEAGSAIEVLKRDGAAQESLFDDSAGLRELAEREIADWEAAGLRLVTVLDDGYPENLRGVHDRPPLLFVSGSLAPGDDRAVAVVGARRASPSGVAAARSLAQHLTRSGLTVVSGLAAGIDAAAHTGALAAGGRTLAVIGTGLNRSYPPKNAALQRRIAAECAVVSQFWPDAPPTRHSFPIRNAVISGLSLATVVVESSQTGGSRLQARLALEQGRPVFLWHRLLEQPWAREFARRPGVRVVHSAEEITSALARLSATGALVAQRARCLRSAS
jgi:DNA processing protein